MENHFECLWSLFRSIPSLQIEGTSGFCPRNAGQESACRERSPSTATRMCVNQLPVPRHPEDGLYLLSSSIWPANPAGLSTGEADAGSHGIGPGYAVEPASPGVARRGAGRP